MAESDHVPEVGREVPADEALPESRFTTPTDLCPHPERWTSTDGDSTEREVAEMVYGLIRGLQPEAVLETGSGFGEVAYFIADALRQNGHGVLYTIEFDPERVDYVRDRLADWTVGSSAAVVEVIEADTLKWTPPDGVMFDFCWFDSWYPYRVEEFKRYRPFMRAGTIVGFHDTAPGHGGSWADGTDLRSTIGRELRPMIRMIHLPTPRGLTIGEVLHDKP